MMKLSLATTACALMLSTPAAAQTPPPPSDPNAGAITATGNMDVLTKSPYIFRGIVQESRPKLTMWPAGDIGIALYSGKGALKSASINFGIWNSLQTGSSGLDGASNKLHYEEDFYATTGLTFSKATFATTYTAYTSPNGGFGTVHELAFKGAISNRIAPYVLVAQELGAIGADALTFGETTKTFNSGKRAKGVFLFGLGVTY